MAGFEVLNMVQNGANFTRLCVLILPFRWKSLYSGLVIILCPFLAFYGPKKAIFATRGTKYSILKQKTWSKMEQTLPDYVFWYCPSDKYPLQWIGHNFMAIFGLLWSKKGYFCHQRHKRLNFGTENMVKNGANSTRLCVLILPFRLESFTVVSHDFRAIFFLAF